MDRFDIPNFLPVDWTFCKVKGKAPYELNWRGREYPRAVVQASIDSGECTGYGLLTGDGLLDIDVDGPRAHARLMEISQGKNLDTVSWTSGKPDKFHLLYKLNREQSIRFFYQASSKNAEECRYFESWGTKGEDEEQLDFRYQGCQSVLPPSPHPDTGKPYQWINSPENTKVLDAPQWLIEELELLLSGGGSKCKPAPKAPKTPKQEPKKTTPKPKQAATIQTPDRQLSDILENDILPRLTVEEIYGPYVDLSVTGSEIRGICPLHPGAENPSSFCINADTKRYHCKSCEDGGGVVQFLYAINGGVGRCRGRDFVQVVSELAEMAGVDLPEYRAPQRVQIPHTLPVGDLLAVNYDQHGNPLLPKQSEIAFFMSEKYRDQFAWNSVTKSFWCYSNGLWTEEDDQEIRRAIISELDAVGLGYSNGTVAGTFELLKSRVVVKKWESPKHLIPLQNGALDLQTMELKPHQPAYYFTWQLPYPYNAAATCQPIIDWLHQVSCGDSSMVQVLRAYLNAIVKGRSDLQRFVELLGPGGTGKSTYARLAVALVGKDNTVTTDLRSLEENRFETAMLYGKRFAQINDSDRYGAGVSVLKAITGQDRLRYELKGKQQKDGFVYQGMVLITANESIQSTDYTSGLERRRLTIPFRNRIESKDQKDLINIGDNTVTGEFAQYLPGLLNWVLQLTDAEVSQLIRNTDVATPSLQQAKAESLLETNPLAEWANSCLVADKDAKTYVGIAKMERVTEDGRSFDRCQYVDKWLYASYVEYSKNSGTNAVSTKRFSGLLEDLCKQQLKIDCAKCRDDKGSYFRGLRFRSSYESLPWLICGPTTQPDASNSIPDASKITTHASQNGSGAAFDAFCTSTGNSPQDSSRVFNDSVTVPTVTHPSTNISAESSKVFSENLQNLQDVSTTPLEPTSTPFTTHHFDISTHQEEINKQINGVSKSELLPDEEEY